MDQLIRGRRRQGGMTLVEVMIAFVLLGIGLLAMLAMQLHAIRGGQKGRHYTEASKIAQDKMEELHNLGWSDGQFTPGPFTAPQVEVNEVSAYGTTVQEQSYNVSYRVSPDATNPQFLRQIDVVVTWYEPQDPPPPAAPLRRFAITSVRYNDG